jgi:hypothetical protein
VLSAIFAATNLIFASARIAISTGEIHIQLGLVGPRIPIAEVAAVELAPSGTNRLGMGVGNDLRGTTTYRLWGRNERAVHVTRTDGTKVILVVRDAEAIARAIEDAMARHAGAGNRARVAAPGHRDRGIEADTDELAPTRAEVSRTDAED